MKNETKKIKQEIITPLLHKGRNENTSEKSPPVNSPGRLSPLVFGYLEAWHSEFTGITYVPGKDGKLMDKRPADKQGRGGNTRKDQIR